MKRGALPSNSLLLAPAEWLLALLCLGGLVLYSYVHLYEVPFIGFDFLDSGEITEVYVTQPGGNTLQPKDRLLKFDGQAWDDYLRSAPNTAITTHQAGDRLQITVQRGDQILQLDWIFPGWNRLEFQERMANSGWLLLAYLFWLAGALTLASLRPRNLQRYLLAAFNFSLASWIITGSISAWNVWGSSDVFHLVNWLLVPLAWHLNWNLPRPLENLPNWVWPAIYGLAGIGAAIDQLITFPFNIYPIPLFLAAFGTITLLLIHLKAQPANRRQVMILLTGFSIAILPGMARLLLPIERLTNLNLMNYLAASALILVPVSYFYALTYRQLGAPELRASSALTVITYGVWIFLFNYLVIYWFADRLQVLVTPTPMVIVIAIANCLVTIWFYPSYRRLIEHKFLGIPLPPYRLLTTVSGRLLTAQDEAELRRLLRDDICSSLLIRQAALLKIRPPGHPGQRIEPLFTLNLSADQLPQAADLAHLTMINGQAPRAYSIFPSSHLSWLRLCLTKQVEPDFQILALLGQRDPGDYYAPTEIPVLQTLLDSTAMALVNLEQKEKLHFLYQNPTFRT